MILQARHYQTEGISWLTTPNVLKQVNDLFPTACRHILSDAPGAGKSFQASEAARALSNSTTKAVLVICPAHLCKQWFQYLMEQYPDDTVVWLEGSRASKQADANVPAQWYIVSVQSLRQHEFMEPLLTKLIMQHKIDDAIIDESHYVKNPDAIQSKVTRRLTRPELIPHVQLLTATPIMKEANDLYMQLRICDPIANHSLYQWLRDYCWFTMTAWGPQDVSLKRGADFSQWMMGRTYQDIGLELPPLISPPPVVHKLQPVRRRAYDDIKDYWYSEIVAGESLTANSAMEVMHLLRKITDGPDKLADLVAYLADDPKPCLIACTYRTSVKHVAEALRTHGGYTVLEITGEVPADDRTLLAKQRPAPDVIVATMASISEGVDLSHCQTVYFYEEDWAPGKHYQFLSRVRRHRDQTDTTVTITEDRHLVLPIDPNDTPVLVRYFHADRTIDQRIHAVLDHRGANAKDIVRVELGI